MAIKSSLKLFLSFVYVNIVISIYAFNKSIKLNNSHLGASGISVSITANHVDTTNNIWHLNPSTQDGTDIELELESEWGFHPLLPSTITLIINGSTPNITKLDGELLILFGVANQYYFSLVIRLEDNTAWKSYPDFKNESLAFANNIFMELIASSTDDRWDRLSNNDQWTNIEHPHLYKTGLKWPLKMSITNDPLQNTTSFQLFVENRVLSGQYKTCFPVNQGLNVYLMNDASDGKPFDIFSIDVIYSYMTLSPTISPTILQSTSITQMPTISPSTNNPTPSPTTPAPVLMIGDDESDGSQPISTTNAGEGESVPDDNSITTKWRNIYDPEFSDRTESQNDTMYIVIIVILGSLLCIVSIILLCKYRKKDLKEINSENNNVISKTGSKSPKSISKYLEKQLAESIANSVDSPKIMIIPGSDIDGNVNDDEDDSSYDSDEEMYRKCNHESINTETTTFTIRHPNIDNVIETIQDIIEDNEGTPDEQLNINDNESENQTITIPMNPVISI